MVTHSEDYKERLKAYVDAEKGAVYDLAFVKFVFARGRYGVVAFVQREDGHKSSRRHIGHADGAAI